MPRHGTLVLLAALYATGCASRPSLPQGSVAAREFSGRVDLHGTGLTLHFASPVQPLERTVPLVLYASGDGGWFGTATAMFRTIAAGGFPTVGFSSRAFLKIEQHGPAPLTAGRIGESYSAILDEARRALALPAETPVLLSGWSRGASLGVLAASLPEVDRAVAGVVAIGLPRDEQLDVEPTDDDDPALEVNGARPQTRTAAREWLMYPLIARIAPRRFAVVQASNDRYLRAADARTLFGPDTDLKKFFEVEASNHRFGGGTAALERALIDALSWTGRRPS